MKMSTTFLQTMRENPKDADIVSNQLMLRANLVKKLVSGVYSYLPLGLKVLRNIEEIIREEMNAIDSQEILCSALQPRELWDQTGRWDKYGAELMRLKDRHEREFCLGPTHEEVFTDIVRNQVKSYKQMPVNLYQIQTKYRDEKRPRFGLIRGREFLMKDAYTFDIDEAGLDKAYDDMYKAYENVFGRCGLETRAVLADSGAIGGDNTHQFMALSDIGESEVIYCDSCDYAADQEKADSKPNDYNSSEKELEVKEVETPGVKTIEDLCEFMNVKAASTVKSVVYNVNGKPVLVLVRGDREVNDIKFCNAVGIGEEDIEFASQAMIEDVMKTAAGSIGPVGLDCEILVDPEVTILKNFCTGANKDGYHLANVNYGRDFTARVVDLRNTEAGDICPVCGKELKSERGIEVGQIFKLGTGYSESLNCYFIDEEGNEKPMVMGCYGIGVSRTLASIIEQHHDENGIIWPMSVAPYKVYVVPVNAKNEEQLVAAEKIYKELKSEGIEVILDDRDERAGVKFKDSELLGIPLRVTVGKGITEGIVEFKKRNESEKEEIALTDVIEKIKNEIKEATR